MKEKTLRYCGPRWLPRVRLHGVEYFVDERIREFRDVTDFSNAVRFRTDRGEVMLNEFFVTECPVCALEIGVPREACEDRIVCIRCHEPFTVASVDIVRFIY